MKKKVLIPVIAVVAAVAIFGGGDDTATNEEKPAVEYETVDLTDMFTTLDENALRAENTYQDKHVEFTGILANVDSDGNYITLSDPDDEWGWETIQCFVGNDDQLNIVLEKNTGDSVTVKGQISDVGEILGYQLHIDSLQ